MSITASVACKVCVSTKLPKKTAKTLPKCLSKLAQIFAKLC